jgi:hypothetical protein
MVRPQFACVAFNLSDMDIREVVQAFTAMDAYGHPYTVPKCALVSSVGDGSGFNSRIDNSTTLASFVYFGILYYAREDVIEMNTKPMVFTSRRERKVVSV